MKVRVIDRSALAELEPVPGTDRVDDLPEGWAAVRVGDLLNLVNGLAFKPAQWKDHGLPIIRIQNLNNPSAPFNRCPESLPDKFRARHGDLLFAWSGTPGTSFGAHIWRGGDAWINQHIFRVEFDNERLDKSFLRLAINRNLDDYTDQAHGGVGLAHITKSQFEQSVLVLPPLAEQHRIAEAVELLLARVEDVLVHLGRIPSILRRFRQAVLAEACSGRLTEDWREARPELEPTKTLLDRVRAARSDTNRSETAIGRGKSLSSRAPAGVDADDIEHSHLPEIPDYPALWTLTTIRDIAHAIQYGTSVRADADSDRGVPIIRMGNIQDGRLELSNLKYIDPASEDISKFMLEPGDILFNRTNSPELVGKTAPVVTDIGAVFASYLVRIKVDLDLAASSYLSAWINSAWGREWASKVKTDGVSQSNINASTLARMPVPLPSLGEQHEIERRVEVLFELADAVQRRIEVVRKQSGTLHQAILSRAFSGKLVPTEVQLARQEGRDYEPATALLERIRVAEVTRPRQTEHTAGRKRGSMSTPRPDAIRNAVLSMPSDAFTFDELRTQVTSSYDELKDALFSLLRDPDPILKQAFDQEAKLMKLVRVRK